MATAQSLRKTNTTCCIIIGVGKPKPGQPVGFRSAKKKAKSDSTATKARAVGGK